ncbi:MAG: SDR family oxidoreductase [Thermoleophilaceae bacterium]
MALPPPAPKTTCLVTGASSGIGADIARELARRGHGVTLVARREERLLELAAEIEQAGVRTEVVACDVSDSSARARMVAELDRRGLDVEVLVNNAGFGSAGRFQELDSEGEVQMVRTNVEAVVALCATYVPRMVARGRGAILNVASIAGYQPLPGQATYSATKAFVLTFSDALYGDLGGTGVSVTALAPGPVSTEFADVAGLADELSSLPSFAVMSAEQTAAAAVSALERGRRTVAPGPLNALSALAGHYVPRSLLLPLARRFYPAGK